MGSSATAYAQNQPGILGAEGYQAKGGYGAEARRARSEARRMLHDQPKFDTEYLATRDALTKMREMTQRTGVEYATVVVQYYDYLYTYLPIIRGASHSVPQFFDWYRNHPAHYLPEVQPLSWAHSHPTSEEFSEGDRLTSRAVGLPGHVATPKAYWRTITPTAPEVTIEMGSLQ
jgi:proteasome lid subunit RPN8/RPN11